MSFRWQDIDLGARRLSVRQAARLSGYTATVGTPKTRAAIRTVGLDDGTVEILRAWKDEQKVVLDRLDTKATFVFADQDGSMMHPQTMALRFAAVCKRVGAPPIGLHGLRHTHATMALEAGVPLKVVSERLGHASIQITADTYQHVLEHLQQDAADAIGALLQPKSKRVMPTSA